MNRSERERGEGKGDREWVHKKLIYSLSLSVFSLGPMAFGGIKPNLESVSLIGMAANAPANIIYLLGKLAGSKKPAVVKPFDLKSFADTLDGR